MKIRFAFLVVVALAFSLSFSGCACTNSAVNGSDSVRWWLFSNFGANKICPEMKKRGVPLKMAQLGPTTQGRFFPQDCEVQVDEAHHTISMKATGTGYVVLPFTRRVGFFCSVAVEYRPDFHMTDDGMYVWGQFNRLLAPPELRILGVENPIINLATQTPIGDMATVLGQGVVQSEIGKGFTVVRQDDGDDFTMGHLDPPAKPTRAFKPGKGHQLLATDETTVHATAREYLGPLAVTENGAALYFHAKLSGQPLVFAVVDRASGDLWRQSYQAGQPLGPAPSAPITYGGVALGETTQKFLVPKGEFYLVVENQAAPPVAAFGISLPIGEQMSDLAYTIEVGDR